MSAGLMSAISRQVRVLPNRCGPVLADHMDGQERALLFYRWVPYSSRCLPPKAVASTRKPRVVGQRAPRAITISKGPPFQGEKTTQVAEHQVAGQLHPLEKPVGF